MLPFDALATLPPDALPRALEYAIGLGMGMWLLHILKARLRS